ncbi:MAG TPA: hypothetical protein VN617_09545 [Rhodoferax sp.]|nr:hypothetical protein [Rhodoferax sp.]
MKAFLTATLVFLSPALALAQTSAAPDASTATTPAAKPAVKPVVKHEAKHEIKHETKHEARHEIKRETRHETRKARVSTRRQNLKSQAVNMAAGIHAADVALTPAELAIAKRIYVGTFPCELGESVTVTADPKSPGYFDLQMKKARYHLAPVTTATGAIRLEDPVTGAVWLQLPDKSMLLNEKLGKRLADACESPAQVTATANAEVHPGPSLFATPMNTDTSTKTTK